MSAWKEERKAGGWRRIRKQDGEERVMFGEPNLSKRGKHGKPTNAHDGPQGLRKGMRDKRSD